MSIFLRCLALVALVVLGCLVWGEEDLAHWLFPSVPADVALTQAKDAAELSLPMALFLLSLFIILAILLFVLFKAKILPHLAAKLTNWLTGQDDVYDAQSDELHQILQDLGSSSQREALAPLDELCQRRGSRLRHWTEYAHLLRTRFKDPRAAIEVLHRAYRAVPEDEDKALILYRIAGIYEQDLHDAQSAKSFYHKAAESYPHCSYGKQAGQH